MTKVLITGIAGQDGSYLAEFLLEKGYDVFGMVRRPIADSFERIQHLRDQIQLVEGDLMDQSSLDDAIKVIQPDEVYNLAALSFVPSSWKRPALTGVVGGVGVARILDAIRNHKADARFYQASSSEIFGRVKEIPQSESTPLHPLSPYGVAKAYGHWITVNYRESFNIFACSGILFNHESPRRGLAFVTRKVTNAAARIKLGLSRELRLGNMDTKRDWGFAGDYVEAMWLMLQQDEPDDYIIATGEAHSVRELVALAFDYAGLDWKDYVAVDPELIRPMDIDILVGDSSKGRKKLQWRPKKSFRQLVEMMVDADLKALQK